MIVVGYLLFVLFHSGAETDRLLLSCRSEDIMLPPRLIKLRHDPMDEREEDFYQALYTQSQAQFNTYLQTGTVLNNYAHIFDILIRCVTCKGEGRQSTL
jgi:hypothetical protein